MLPGTSVTGGPQLRLLLGRFLVGSPDRLARGGDVDGDRLDVGDDPVERVAQADVLAHVLDKPYADLTAAEVKERQEFCYDAARVEARVADEQVRRGGELPPLLGVPCTIKEFVAVAERFVGTPYLWGGKTNYGLDCSGLSQVALNACGIHCPRDTYMQEAVLGWLAGLFRQCRAKVRRRRLCRQRRTRCCFSVCSPAPPGRHNGGCAVSRTYIT